MGYIYLQAKLSIVPDSHITTIRVGKEIDSYYIYVLLKSLQTFLEKNGEGSTNQKELKPNTLQEIFVPVPPYEEQLRICKAIREMHNLINDIEDSIN